MCDQASEGGGLMMVSWNQCQLTYLPWKLLSKQPHFIEYRDLLFLTAGSLFATDILIAKKSQVFLQKNLKILKNYSKFLEHFSSFKDWLKMCLPIIRVEISVNWLLIFMFYILGSIIYVALKLWGEMLPYFF